jgi:transposase-like protein
MGKRTKYSPAVKLKAVRMHLDEGIPALTVAQAFGINERYFYRLVQAYKSFGESAFQKQKHNSKYSADFKARVVQEYLSGEGSLDDLAIRYGISSHVVIYRWVSKYSSYKEPRDDCPKPEVRMTATKKTTKRTLKSTAKRTTEKEREQIIDWYFDNDCSYKATAEHFGCSYSQVYSWVKKFKTQGVAGLKDGRGRRKSDEERTPEELHNIEIERYKKIIDCQNKEIEFLKKLKETDWG